MAYRKTTVSPVRQQWRYLSLTDCLALSHRYMPLLFQNWECICWIYTPNDLHYHSQCSTSHYLNQHWVSTLTPNGVTAKKICTGAPYWAAPMPVSTIIFFNNPKNRYACHKSSFLFGKVLPHSVVITNSLVIWGTWSSKYSYNSVLLISICRILSFRYHSVHAPSHWETTLHCKIFSRTNCVFS